MERKCGYAREAGSIFGSGANKLKLNFVTSNTGGTFYNYGFWLEVVASPPKENHKIEIRCNRANTDQIDIFHKLKIINEKLKRLNKTLSANKSKLNVNLHNKAKFFIENSNRKFLNMTNSIAQIGKRLYNTSLISKQQQQQQSNNRFGATRAPNKLSKSHGSTRMSVDLQSAIEDFFATKDQLNSWDAVGSKKTLNQKKGENKVLMSDVAVDDYEMNANEKKKAEKESSLEQIKKNILMMNNNNSNKKKPINKKVELEETKKKFNNALQEAISKLEKQQKPYVKDDYYDDGEEEQTEDESTNGNGKQKVVKENKIGNKKVINLSNKAAAKDPKQIDRNSELEWIKALDSLNNDLDFGADLLDNKELHEALEKSFNGKKKKQKQQQQPIDEKKEEIATTPVDSALPTNDGVEKKTKVDEEEQEEEAAEIVEEASKSKPKKVVDGSSSKASSDSPAANAQRSDLAGLETNQSNTTG